MVAFVSLCESVAIASSHTRTFDRGDDVLECKWASTWHSFLAVSITVHCSTAERQRENQKMSRLAIFPGGIYTTNDELRMQLYVWLKSNGDC